jgi:hypothetical protein
MPAYSVYSEEHNGLAEAYRRVRQFGWQPVALTRPAQYAGVQGLLILVEPGQTTALPGVATDVTDADARGLVQWVERGNMLLLCSRRPTAVHAALHVDVFGGSGADAGMVTAAEVEDVGGYTDDVDRVAVEGEATLRAPGALPLWYVSREPGAVLFRRGRGRVLVVADPSLLTARGLRRQDNAVFLYNVCRMAAKGDRVYFDEYDHGLGAGPNFWSYLRYHGQQWIALPIVLVVGMGVWAVGVRLGRPVPRPAPVRADAVDYASAIARIYHQAGVHRLLGRTTVRDFMGDLARHLRLRPTALPADVLAAWKRRHPAGPGYEETSRLQELLRGVVVLRRGQFSEHELLRWARAFDEFQAEVLRA